MLLIKKFKPAYVNIAGEMITMNFHIGDIVIDKAGREFSMLNNPFRIVLLTSTLEIVNTDDIIRCRFGDYIIRPSLGQLEGFSDLNYQIRRYFRVLAEGDEDVEPQYELIHELECMNTEAMIDRALTERDLETFKRLTEKQEKG